MRGVSLLVLLATLLAASEAIPFFPSGSRHSTVSRLSLVPRVLPPSMALSPSLALRGGASSNATATAAVSTATYPGMTVDEVCSILDDVPIYAITSPTGEGVVLKSASNASDASIFYFYLSPNMANATMAELKRSNPSMQLKLTAYRLGQVYFKILKNNTSSAAMVTMNQGTAAAATQASAVDYRLVPDTRDLIGARMLVNMDEEDGAAIRAKGKMTEELAQKALAKAMKNSPMFNSTYGNVPLFMIQQMRIQTAAKQGGAPAKMMLPLYFSLADMVSVWQRFAAADKSAGKTEPAIHVMDLDQLVKNMMQGGEVDFKTVLLGKWRGGRSEKRSEKRREKRSEHAHPHARTHAHTNTRTH
jgi:hypothetical protein